MLKTSKPVLALRSVARSLGLTRFLGRLAERGKTREETEALEAYRREPKPWATACINGLELKLKVENENELIATFIKKNDARLISHLLERLGPGAVFWDIGANIGVYGFFMALKPGCKEVISFDPDPWCQARLEANRALNALTNVRLMPIGLSNRRASMSFEMATQSIAGSSHLCEDPSKAAPERLVQVEVWPGDEVARERQLPQPNAVKIDVEGFELEVVQGMSKTLSDPACRTLMIEVHFSVLESRGLRDAPKRIEQALKNYGFDRINYPDMSHLFATKSSV